MGYANNFTGFSKIDEALEEAYSYGKKGEGSLDALYLSATVARNTHLSSLKGKVDAQNAQLEELQNAHRLKLSEFNEQFWNRYKTQFSIGGLTEALAMRNFRPWTDIPIYFLLVMEFFYGFWLFKQILGDDTILNTLSAFVVGLMVIIISFGLKIFPEAFEDNWFKYIYGGVFVVSAGVFIYYLAHERGTVSDTLVTLSSIRDAGITKETGESLVFALSLLCTLTVGSAFFSIMAREPQKNQEAKKYLASYNPILKIEDGIAKHKIVMAENDFYYQKLLRMKDDDVKVMVFQAYSAGLNRFFPSAKKNQRKKELQERWVSDFKNPIGEKA